MTKYDAALILCAGSRDEDEAWARLLDAGWGFSPDCSDFAAHLFGQDREGLDILLWCWKRMSYGGPLPEKEAARKERAA